MRNFRSPLSNPFGEHQAVEEGNNPFSDNNAYAEDGVSLKDMSPGSASRAANSADQITESIRNGRLIQSSC